MTVVEDDDPIAPEDGTLTTGFAVSPGAYDVRWEILPDVVREARVLVPEGEAAVQFDL